MTPKQIKLLKRCVLALRTSQVDEYVNELVEVGGINGVDPRTAESLVSAGILAYDLPYNASECTNTHVRFRTLEELENA